MVERDGLGVEVTDSRCVSTPVSTSAQLPGSVTELASMLRAAGADVLADRLERALADEVKLLALSIDERAILAALEDPSESARAAAAAG